MAIWGGDGSTYEQMIYADTIEDLKTLLETDLGDSKPYKYVGLPTHDINGNLIPVSERVFDLRKKGWYGGDGKSYINMEYYSGMDDRYLYCNGWTILGISILDGGLFSKGWKPTLYIYDLTIKNAYVYANRTASFIFGGVNSGGFYTLINCKVSATLDGSTSNYASVYVGSYTSDLEQTSMNIKLHGYANISYGDNASFGKMKNSLIHFETSNKGFSTIYLLINGWAIFSKIEGTIKSYGSSVTIFFGNNSGYNVVDLEVINGSSSGQISLSLENRNGSPCIYNSEKIGSGVQVGTSGAMFPVTSTEMVSKSYLESINFLVGDAPAL